MDDTVKRSKILIVDDDQFTLTLLSSVLEQNGYDVVQAKDGEDALNIMVLEEPDMAMLDINLPGMSGLDLAQRMRNDSSLPFMFLSGVCDEDVVKRAVEYGASGYLVKPVDVHSLLPTLESALARGAELKLLRQRESTLTSALAAGRETSIAVGVVMERYHLGKQQAFALMRSHARSSRKTINDVASMIIEGAEALNLFRPQGDVQMTPLRPASTAPNAGRAKPENGKNPERSERREA
jgi:response regulator NasT